VAWADVREFHRKPVPFRHTQLGRITGLSQVLTRRHVFLRLSPTSYEWSADRENGQARTFVIEPARWTTCLANGTDQRTHRPAVEDRQ
jgi:hypothetical protein